MKNEIKRLEKIKSKVFSMYAYTEGINEDLSKRSLIDMLKHVSLDIENITNYIADEIDNLNRIKHEDNPSKRSLINMLKTEGMDEDLLDKVFFYGDYLADRTKSGKEESGIRLVHNVDKKLKKEEVEELYNLLDASSQMLYSLKIIKKRLRTIIENIAEVVSKKRILRSVSALEYDIGKVIAMAEGVE